MPAVCSSAPATVPCAQPAALRREASIIVEAMEACQSMRRPGRRRRMVSSSMGMLFELQSKVDVDGAGRVRDRAAGDEVCPCFGIGTDVFKRDAAGQLDLRATVNVPYPLGGFGRCQIIEQQMTRAGSECFIEIGRASCRERV